MDSALIVTHTCRLDTSAMAADAAAQLREAGLEVRMLEQEAVSAAATDGHDRRRVVGG